ncbi:hypothetical protein [Labrys wisconsinensis]|uniref:Uncharacterized protein n=1 Tax=Labrys wisconsinensis TaxID=425677 RepID=A0ABU0JGV5_9HYPH|nr:hypothetical protein [Labrys wisconsinensis]MDQ0473513.1 hypothetical protein [Labrys wisconsinensis]
MKTASAQHLADLDRDDDTDADEYRLAGLARLAEYAYHDAVDLKADTPAYCLRVAITAIVEEMAGRGFDLDRHKLGQWAAGGRAHRDVH